MIEQERRGACDSCDRRKMVDPVEGRPLHNLHGSDADGDAGTLYDTVGAIVVDAAGVLLCSARVSGRFIASEKICGCALVVIAVAAMSTAPNSESCAVRCSPVKGRDLSWAGALSDWSTPLWLCCNVFGLGGNG
jgi:hypothetical protein